MLLSMVKELFGALGVTLRMSTAWPSLICIGAMLMSGVMANAAEPADEPDLLPQIVRSMESAQSDVHLPRQVVREYHVSTPKNITTDSEVIAQMDFASPARYVIQKRYGSLKAEFVVKNVLQHELEISASNERLQAAAITHQNYDFRLLGGENIDGHSCYVLQLIPRRGQPELIRGRVWVDQQTFLIRRIDGDLAKSPSWWVKAAHVDIRFADFRGLWLQTSWQALADVRCFGAQQLTSQVIDYAGAPVASKNTVNARLASRRNPVQ